MASVLLDVAVRAVLIAAGTGLILWLLRIRTAAGRHVAWTTVVVAMLLLPIWSLAGPRVPLAVLPAGAASADSQAGANGAREPPQSSATWPLPVGFVESLPVRSESSRGMWVFIAAYLLGAVALFIRLATGTVQARRLRRAAVIRAGRATSARCATPITVGWFSPVLILPEGWDRWSAAQLDAVLTHEREHASRRDPLVQWLALLNRAIFWFHPLTWWLERRLASLAEEACDAAVIRAGHAPQDYCDYLIEMARTVTREGRRLNVVGMAMPGSGLPDRMRHVFEEGLMKPLSRAQIMCTLAFCTISSIALAGATLAPQPAGATEWDATVANPVPVAAALPILEAPTQSTVATPAASASQTSPKPTPPPRVVAAKPPSVMVFVPQTDLSGEWVLVDSEYTGRGRGGRGGGGGGGGGERMMISIASGAAFNCGTTCTIDQNGGTLTLTRPDQPDVIAPDSGTVVLNLDGSDSTIRQSASSEAQFKATAKWDGAKLVVTRVITESSSVTQTLSMEDGKLTVVTMFSRQDAPVTMTYERR